MMLKQQPSPNFDDRHSAVDMLILHYTGMRSGKEALARLCDPQSKVSAHYVVEEDGTVFALVPEEKRAWHAGVSSWRGKEKLNDCSIGIEIVNPGHEFGYRPFPPAQMEAVIALCKGILARHAIPACNVVGHSDVAPSRKEDPGELFDWARLAEEGIGLWPDAQSTVEPHLLHKKGDEGEGVLQIQKLLAEYGYAIDLSGIYDKTTEAVVRAFQRHFLPHHLNGEWTEECDIALTELLEKLR